MKIRGREKLTKREVPIEQGSVKTQLEILEVWKTHSFLIYTVCIVHWSWNVPVWHNETDLTLKTIKTRDQDEAHPKKWSLMIYHYIYFPFAPLLHWPKITRINIIQISQRKSFLLERNFSPIWINYYGYMLMDTMADSIVCITMLTSNLYSNPIPKMVDPFILVPLHLQSQCQSR